MIRVTRFNGSEFMLNALLLESVEETPDTLITLVTGKKFMVRESADEVCERVREYMEHVGAVRMQVKTNVAEDITGVSE